MKKNVFTKFDDAKKVLGRYGYRGCTCKRQDGNGRLTYKYHSIHYHCVPISVTVGKLKPNEPLSDKIVLNINVNGRNLDGWNDFINTMNNINKIYNSEFRRTFITQGNDEKRFDKKHRGNDSNR